jgi:hypothetical protein
MGLDYGFEILAPSASAVQLVEALAAHVVPDDAARLLAAVREDPRRVMDLARRNGDHDFSLCLSFLFEPDQWLTEFYHATYRSSVPVTSRVAIGCVWSSLHVGDRFLLFEATAATTSMSLMFEHSPTVREVFVGIAREAGALLVAFDDEEDELLVVWPREGRLGVHISEDYVDDELQSRADPYCEAVLSAVESGPLGRGSDV